MFALLLRRNLLLVSWALKLFICSSALHISFNGFSLFAGLEMGLQFSHRYSVQCPIGILSFHISHRCFWIISRQSFHEHLDLCLANITFIRSQPGHKFPLLVVKWNDEGEDWPPSLICQGEENEVANMYYYPWLPSSLFISPLNCRALYVWWTVFLIHR